MLHIKRSLNIIAIMCIMNAYVLIRVMSLSLPWIIVMVIIMGLFFAKYNLIPVRRKINKMTMNILIGGCELILNAIIVFTLDIILYIFIIKYPGFLAMQVGTVSINAVIAGLIFLIILFNGLLRIIVGSSQVGVVLKVLLILGWWIPVWNLVLYIKSCHIAKREYMFELAKYELNNQRAENEICKTKYPLLMVHGIFWRDWQLFNYWGRIPKELVKNGAKVFYGNQHSAAHMSVCGHDLKDQILKIIKDNQCEKVNIIGHSKGGLDARYVASMSGMSQYVASVTTVGTPNHGSTLVDRLWDKLPEGLIKSISRKYDKAYQRLGDLSPDFYQGVYDLTSKQCDAFNEVIKPVEGIYYQSYTSKMSHCLSAGFPLNIGYMILKKHAGENDGFVSVESSKYGVFQGCIETRNVRGVSHGDMIDLMRENIKGFDVCEYYVEIVKALKNKGF